MNMMRKRSAQHELTKITEAVPLILAPLTVLNPGEMDLLLFRNPQAVVAAVMVK